MTDRPRQSISRRLTRLIGISAAIAALLVPAVGIAHQYRVSVDAVETTTAMVEDSSLPVLSYLLWTVNQEQVERLLEGLLSDPVISAVELAADGIGLLSFAEDGFLPARSEAVRYEVRYDDGSEQHPVGVLTIWKLTAFRLTLASSPIIGGIVVGLVLVSGLIALFAVMVRRHVTHPLTALIEHVDTLGESSELPPWWDEALHRDPGLETHRIRVALDRALRRNHEEIILRRDTERDLEASLEEKGVLIQEIHHRVKNNLQLVMSFLSLQRASVTDSAALHALEDSQNRVMSMAIIHEMLYQGERSDAVMIDEYFESLAGGLHPADSPGLAITVTAEEVSVPIDTAVPCGLVVTELITNAIKHAFGNTLEGKIVVAAHRADSDGCLRVSVEDNGRGLPEGWSLESEGTLGARIIDALTQQLGAVLSVESGPGGARFTLTVPVDAPRSGCDE